MLSLAELTYLVTLVISTRVKFWRVINLWAKPELDIVEVVEAGLTKPELDVIEMTKTGFRDCFIIGIIERDTSV